MKRLLSIVCFCVFLFSPTGYADDITIPYKAGHGDGIYTGEVLDGLQTVTVGLYGEVSPLLEKYM